MRRRQLAIWLGLLAVLLHAGLAVLHRAPAPGSTVASATVAMATGEAEFARAIALSMCGRSSPDSGAPAHSPPPPGIPCLDCCCPPHLAMAAPAQGLGIVASDQNLCHSLVAAQRAAGEAVGRGDRPPVRAPPRTIA